MEASEGIQTGLSALKHKKTETTIAKQGSYLETKQKRKRCSQKVFVLSNHEKKQPTRDACCLYLFLFVFVTILGFWYAPGRAKTYQGQISENHSGANNQHRMVSSQGVP